MTSFFQSCCLFLLYIHAGHFGTVADVHLKLSNDGPAILDSSITFYALLRGDIPDTDYEYVFEDNTKSPDTTHSVMGGKSANLTLLVQSHYYKEDMYTMRVTVYRKIFEIFREKVASGKMTFVLTSGINGNIFLNGQDNPEFIPVGRPLNFTFILHDPSHFFDGATFIYIWKFNQTSFFDKNETVVYNVSSVGKLLASLSIFARKSGPNSTLIFKSGSIDQEYKALVPVGNLTVRGTVWLKRGDVLNLDISCSGTPPFRYCDTVFLDNSTDPCNGEDPITSTQCSFQVMHYFRNAGKYRVGLMVKNNLNMINRTVEIQIYDVDKRPQLSTIIFPIVSCCIGIVIVVIGTAYHLQQRRTYTIEVADFDFQEPVMLIEKSFVTRVKEAIRDAFDGYRQGRSTSSKMVVNGSSRTTPIPSHYISVS